MRRFNLKNWPEALIHGVGALLAAGGGIALVLTGLGAFTHDHTFVVWSPALVGAGFALVAMGAVAAMLGVGKLYERSWGDDVEIPSLTPKAYLVALTQAERPSWTCTGCRVVQPGTGIGTCVYCDRGVNFYVVESDEDLKMVIASMS